MREDERVTCRFTYGSRQEGPPHHVHGGALAALLDEIMGVAAWYHRPNMMAVHLEFDYRRPVPLGVEIAAAAWVSGIGNRSVRLACELQLPDGTVAVEGKGIFAEAPAMFTERGFYG